VDLSHNTSCRDVFDSEITFNQSELNTIPAKHLTPYSIYEFFVTV